MNNYESFKKNLEELNQYLPIHQELCRQAIPDEYIIDGVDISELMQEKAKGIIQPLDIDFFIAAIPGYLKRDIIIMKYIENRKEPLDRLHAENNNLFWFWRNRRSTYKHLENIEAMIWAVGLTDSHPNFLKEIGMQKELARKFIQDPKTTLDITIKSTLIVANFCTEFIMTNP
jgi:hypothetical protein